MKLNKFWATAVMASAAFCGVASAQQGYPKQPIRLVVPYGAGGPTDAVARIVGQAMSTELGTPIIVENKAGGASSIGTNYVVRAQPDGYTLLVVAANLVLNPATGIETPYDALRDLKPIAALANMPILVAVNPKVPAKDLGSLIEWIRAQPESVPYASPGAGTLTQSWGEMLAQKYKLKLTHVPYKGSAEASRAALAGDVPLLFDLGGVTAALIAQGKLQGIVTPGAARAPGLPNLPTARESGFKDVDAESFLGLVGPANLPQDIAAKLNAAANTALKNPRVIESIRSLGLTPTGGTAEAFGSFLSDELKRWTAVAKSTGIRPAQ
ncbi:Bug family tripartite tricarboxylate transporter substrate binding protein [Pseudorhodoferax soli]|uniref:Tripartite-type tricarboxylate transporter receptor subunit TctC n=1 Tax=Pseudorhodoferax soli TaxID=545864 RepID=A0A368X6K8_9BURK|nr:tripartite tricarboxylate transporter substrate binding protein [Pseudorhodoferax soli]RCW63620.1 tripartite-type tricarboxylate transporter receptor subunit TctC [Pseudorhodoferax soli]